MVFTPGPAVTPVFGARHSRRRKWRSPRRSIYECYELTRADFMTVARRFHYHFLKRQGKSTSGPLVNASRGDVSIES